MNQLAFQPSRQHRLAQMASPAQPVTLTLQQVEDLCRHFSNFRHDVNGCLSLIVAATELIRYSPDVVKRMAGTLAEQPPRILGKVREFIEECERVLGVRSTSEPAWYPDLWKRLNAAPGAPSKPITASPDEIRSVHSEIVQLGKDLAHIGFIITGGRVLAAAQSNASLDVNAVAAEQLAKVSRKFNDLAEKFEKSFAVQVPATRRMVSGAPSGPVTLAPEHVSLFHRKLTNLQNDVVEHLRPLLELSRLARTNPQEVQMRAQEIVQQPPKISAEVAKFATEFDKTFGILRTA